MKRAVIFLFFSFMLPVLAWAQGGENTGLITRPSSHSMQITIDLLKTAIEEMDLKIIEEIDHAAAAAKNGLHLRPTTVLLFGNPKVGTKLMQADQRAGLDLPLRMLVWEQEGNKVFVSYYNPQQLAEVYELKDHQEVVQKMQVVLEKLAQKVYETK